MKKLLILAVALLGIFAAFTSCTKSSDPLAGTSWRANLDYNEVITLQIGANMTGMAYIQDMEEYGEVEGTFHLYLLRRQQNRGHLGSHRAGVLWIHHHVGNLYHREQYVVCDGQFLRLRCFDNRRV